MGADFLTLEYIDGFWLAVHGELPLSEYVVGEAVHGLVSLGVVNKGQHGEGCRLEFHVSR